MKAMLEFDVPESCSVCKIAHSSQYGGVCAATGLSIKMYEYSRALFCPLKIVDNTGTKTANPD